MYVYQRTEPGVWTVGFFKPDGEWVAEHDCATADEAAQRVSWLNGRGV